MTGCARPAGSTVEMVVNRGDQKLTFKMQRAEIHLQFVKQRVVADDIGYLSLRGFPEPSVVDSVEQNVAAFQEQGVRGLVLDLRGNSGGRIDVGTRLLSHFLPAGATVYEETDRSGRESDALHAPGDQYGLPLVVLVDGGTASMGEILPRPSRSMARQRSSAARQPQGAPRRRSLACPMARDSGDGLRDPLARRKTVESHRRDADEVVEPDAVATAQGDDPGTQSSHRDPARFRP
jgi:hypothetical protein